MIFNMRRGFLLLLWMSLSLILPACVNIKSHPLGFQSTDLEEPIGDGIGFGRDNLMRRWNLLGPFAAKSTDSIETAFLAEEATLDGKREAPGKTFWQVRVFPFTDNGMEFRQAYLEEELHPRNAYFFSGLLFSPRSYQNINVHICAHGSYQAWLNGIAILAKKEDSQTGEAFGFSAKVSLKKGYNSLLIKLLDPMKNPENNTLSVYFSDAQDRPFVFRQ